MKKECCLCLKVFKSLERFINIYAEEWKIYNIESEIEQHLWPMASLKSKSSWLCSSCWLAVHAFHQFYRRIEDVQTNFEDAVKSGNDQKEENKFLQNITAVTEPDETEIDMQQLLKARGNVFKEIESMGNDDRSPKTDRNFKCPKCHQKLNDKKAIEWHKAWHGGTRVSCEICDLMFIDKYELIKHKRIHVTSEKSDFEDAVKSGNDQKEENKFLQNITAVTEPDETEINIQQPLKAGVNVFKEHESMGIDDRSTKTDRNYKCPKCHQKLNDKEAIEWHKAWHGGTRISCEICDLIFIDKYELIKHKRIHMSSDKSNNVVLSCNPDEKSTFKRISNDEVDTETNSNELAYKCSYSSKVFESELPATDHKSSHAGDKWYICEICYLTFSDLEQHEIHKTLHEPPNVNNVTPFTSPQMMEESLTETEGFKEVIDFKEVKEKVKDDSDCSISYVESKCMKQFQCEYCSKKFLYKRSYIKHIARHKLLIAKENAKIGKNASDSNNLMKQSFRNLDHHENIKENQPTISDNIVVQHSGGRHYPIRKKSDVSNLVKESFRCKFCCRELETEQALLSHKAWHQGNLLHCSICDLTFLDRTEFKNHQLAHEQFPAEPDLQNEVEEGYKCTVCSKVLNSRRLYINHNAWHEGTIYRCEICDLKFLDKCHFDGHTESHIPKYWKRCRECRKPFSSATEVLRHYHHMHRNDFPTVCHVCGKNYRCPVSFKRHVDKHNGIADKKVPCKICGRLLTNSINCLKSHMLINHPQGGKYPYVCNICLKPLPTRARVKSHFRLYHATTGFEKNCKICNISIKTLSHSLSHSATHNSLQKYSCQWCDEKFNQHNQLSKHRIKKHPKEREELRKKLYVQV